MEHFASVDYIITAKHYSPDGTARGYIKAQQIKIHRDRGVAITIKDLDKEPTGAPVYARIWQGSWIADCECRGAIFVDPDQPVFFCFECLNRANGSKPRPVIFPPEVERKEIERLILERPVNDIRGLTDMDRAVGAQALLAVQVQEPDIEAINLLDTTTPPDQVPMRTYSKPMVRSWNPGETIEDLHQQQDAALNEWRKALKSSVPSVDAQMEEGE